MRARFAIAILPDKGISCIGKFHIDTPHKAKLAMYIKEVLMSFSRFLTRAVVFIFIAAIAVGCNTASIRRLAWEDYAPKPTSDTIELYVGKVSRPYKPIAILQSKSFGDQTVQSKTRMMKDLRRLARKIGADAVIDIHMLPRRFEGMVMDERVPFPAWRPGEYRAYFLRGTAIVYEKNPSEKPRTKKMEE